MGQERGPERDLIAPKGRIFLAHFGAKERLKTPKSSDRRLICSRKRGFGEKTKRGSKRGSKKGSQKVTKMDQKVTKMDQKVTKMDQKDGQKVTGIDPSQPKREKKTFIGPTLGHLRLKKFLTHNT